MSSVGTREDTAKSLIAHGREAMASGKIDNAIQLYDAAIILDPKAPTPHKMRGDSLFSLERHVEALESYEQALRLWPGYVQALYNRAVVKKALGRLDEALGDLDAVLLLDENNFHAYMTRGDIQIEFGRLQEAQSDYERAATINPGSSSAVFRKGKAALLRQHGVEDRQAIFEYIYKTGAWGRSSDPVDRYFSGTGTRVSVHSDCYVQALRTFLEPFSSKLNAVDIGCGDFITGSKIRGFCANYVACDVVSGLIDFNKTRFSDLDVDFRVLDAVNDALPEGEVVFIREVLQHLSNDDISKIIAKVARTYRYAVITECLPSTEGFTPNLDKVTSDKIRPNVNGSGVVLTQAPFNLVAKEERELCVSPAGRTKLVTTLFSF